ncbi:MAG: J domain-containing protein [Deltaproteobacteria bacterium]|nr:J domain-containing protein [Deltaproteobacteria bacterium]MBT4527858.1 J domain-containing protein [Deltaproteobacteria bacterium]
MDKMGKYKIKWIEFSTQIKIIEKKAKLSEKKLPELIEELKTLQTSVKNISWHKFKRAQRHTKYTGPKNKDQQQSQKKTANNNQQGDATEELNYYEILGVSKNATTEEIKKAFRIRMKEYHPDKHNASDFKWIKEEASRMTKLIQEAYQTLSDPAKRKTYTP